MNISVSKRKMIGRRVIVAFLAFAMVFCYGSSFNWQPEASASVPKYAEKATDDSINVREYIKDNVDSQYVSNEEMPNEVGRQLTIKYLFANKDELTKKTDTITEASNDHAKQENSDSETIDTPILGMMDGQSAIYDIDPESDYYVAMADMTKLNGAAETIDYQIAKHNNDGEAEHSIKFDKNTGIAYIPKNLINKKIESEEDYADATYQMEFYSAVDFDTMDDSMYNVEIVNENPNVTAVSNFMSDTANIFMTGVDFQLVNDETKANLTTDDIQIFVNNAQLPLVSGEKDAPNYAYDPSTGMLSIVSPVVNTYNIRVEIKKPGALEALLPKASAAKTDTTPSLNIWPSSEAENAPSYAFCLKDFDVNNAKAGMKFTYTGRVRYNETDTFSKWPKYFRGHKTAFSHQDSYVYIDDVDDALAQELKESGSAETWSSLRSKSKLKKLGDVSSKGDVNFLLEVPSGPVRSQNKGRQKLDFTGFSPSKGAKSGSHYLFAKCSHIENGSNQRPGERKITMTILKIEAESDNPYVILGFCSSKVYTQSGACVIAVPLPVTGNQPINIDIHKGVTRSEITPGDNYWSLKGAEYVLFNNKSDAQAVLNQIKEMHAPVDVDVDEYNQNTLDDDIIPDESEYVAPTNVEAGTVSAVTSTSIRIGSDNYQAADGVSITGVNVGDDVVLNLNEEGKILSYEIPGDDDTYDEPEEVRYKNTDVAVKIRTNDKGYASSFEKYDNDIKNQQGIDPNDDGIYYLVEVKAPSNGHYLLSEDMITINTNKGAKYEPNKKGIVTVTYQDEPKLKDVPIVDLQLAKISDDPDLTNGAFKPVKEKVDGDLRWVVKNKQTHNGGYTYLGATYGIYYDKACQTPVSELKFVTDESGISNVISIPLDDRVGDNKLYVQEITPSMGYNKDPNVYEVNLKNHWDSDDAAILIAPTSGQDNAFKEVPQYAVPDVVLQKVDNDNGGSQNDPTGEISNDAALRAHLEDAEYTMTFTPLNGGDIERTWVFKTKLDPETGKYIIKYLPEYLVDESQESTMFKYEGKYILPIGDYTLKETKTPTGYFPDDKTYTITVRYTPGNTEGDPIKFSWDKYTKAAVTCTNHHDVNNDGVQYDNVSDEDRLVISRDVVKRGELDIYKVIKDDETADQRTYKNIVFEVKNLTTGEIHFLSTDENGKTSTKPNLDKMLPGREDPEVTAQRRLRGGDVPLNGNDDAVSIIVNGDAYSVEQINSGAVKIGPEDEVKYEVDESKLNAYVPIWYEKGFDSEGQPTEMKYNDFMQSGYDATTSGKKIGGADSSAEVNVNTVGGLPYGDYVINEIYVPSEITAHIPLQKDYPVRIDADGKKVAVDLINTQYQPEFSTQFMTEDKVRPTDGVIDLSQMSPDTNIILYDKISYKNFDENETYTFRATLANKNNNGELLLDKATDMPLTFELADQKLNKEGGDVYVPIELNVGYLKELLPEPDKNGKQSVSLVCFEEAFNAEGHSVKPHNNLEDVDQTITFVQERHDNPKYNMYKVRNEDAPAAENGKYGFEIGTEVTYNVVVENPNTVPLTMNVSDKFVKDAEKYFTEPVVKEVKDATWNNEGTDVKVANITIAPETNAVVTFKSTIKEGAKAYLAADTKDSDSKDDNGKDCNRVDNKIKLDDKDGYRNDAYTTDVEYPGGKLEDKTDDAQTPVKAPDIGTTLTDESGAKTIKSGKTTLVDTVKYSGLTPGKNYVVYGVLMVKETGKALEDGGKPVDAIGHFTAEEASGTVDVKFEVDTTGLDGKELVAFETAYELGDEEVPDDIKTLEDIENADATKVAEHKDIKDKGQTVKVGDVKIGTTLTDKAGRKQIGDNKTVTLVDTIKYEGLTPGKKYVVHGQLMVKDTNNPLVESGKPVEAIGTFTPKKSSGTTQVEFSVNTKGLRGKELVAFETAYELKGKDITQPSQITEDSATKVAEHKDINDKAQTVKVVPGSNFQTGDYIMMGAIFALIMSLAGIAVVYKRRRAHN